jgi:hypothetical protein
MFAKVRFFGRSIVSIAVPEGHIEGSFALLCQLSVALIEPIRNNDFSFAYIASTMKSDSRLLYRMDFAR